MDVHAENVVAEANGTTRQAEPLLGLRDQVSSLERQPCLGEPAQEKSSTFPKAGEDSTRLFNPQPRIDPSTTIFASNECSSVSDTPTLVETEYNWNEIVLCNEKALDYLDPSSFGCHTSGSPIHTRDSGYQTDFCEEQGEELTTGPGLVPCPPLFNPAHFSK